MGSKERRKWGEGEGDVGMAKEKYMATLLANWWESFQGRSTSTVTHGAPSHANENNRARFKIEYFSYILIHSISFTHHGQREQKTWLSWEEKQEGSF